MKNAVAEYLPLSAEELKNLWESAVFVFDTNTLLDLYRISKAERENFFKALEAVRERVWIPRHVAGEFMRNRRTVIADSVRYYETLKKSVKKHAESLQNIVKKENAEFLRAIKLIMESHAKSPKAEIKPEAVLEAVKEKAEEFQKEAEEAINALKSENLPLENPAANPLEEDPVLKSLLELFEGKVGSGFSEQKRREIEDEEWGYRKAHRIPPGYMDKGKYNETERDNACGDLIVWMEILRYAEDGQKDIIFVTADNKEDWWRKINGKSIGPREELRREFAEHTQGGRFHMYSRQGFVRYALDGQPPREDDPVQPEESAEEPELVEEAESADTVPPVEERVITGSIVYGTPLSTSRYQDLLEQEIERLKSREWFLSSQINFQEQHRNQISAFLGPSFLKDPQSDRIAGLLEELGEVRAKRARLEHLRDNTDPI